MFSVSWRRLFLTLGFFVGLALAGRAQGVVPPVPSPPTDLNTLAHQLAEQVRRLGTEITSDLGATQAGPHLVQDVRELAQAVDEFPETLRGSPDPFRVRQSYSSIDATWHHLSGQLSRPGVSSPAVVRAARQVAEIDARIHQALGLNDLPPDYYGRGPAPSGTSDLPRLAHALVDRAEALAAAVRADMVGPGGARPVQDSVNLAQAADAFHDGLGRAAGPDAPRDAYSQVVGLVDRVQADFAQVPPTPRVQSAWQALKAADVLIRQGLQLPNSSEDLNLSAIPANGPSPVVALAGQLVEQVSAFLQVFTPTAGVVPEGGWFLADAQRLRDAAIDFRQDAARGLDAGPLAYEFREVDALWQRLARRTSRIARGRTGPNIQQVGLMGQTIAEIHRLLGLPGYPPALGTFPPPPDPGSLPPIPR